MRTNYDLRLSTYRMETKIAMTDANIDANTHDRNGISGPHSFSKKKYKHVVISGGGPSLFTIFGAIKWLISNNFLSIDDVESIYGCSSGGFLSVCLCLIKLGLTIEELETYIVTRCWKTLFINEVLDFKTAFDSKGLFDDGVIKKAISPLLTAVGLSTDITLNTLYESCGIKLVMFSVDVNSRPLQKVRISYETFSDLPVYKALTMTMGLPGVVSPTFVDGMCLVDGGLMANYPFMDCLQDITGEGIETEDSHLATDTVIGFKIKWEKRREPIDSSSNIITFLAHLMKMMAVHIDTSSRDIEDSVIAKENTIECGAPDAGNPTVWVDLFGNKELRENYVLSGIESAKRFIACQKEMIQQIQPECYT